MIIKKKIYQRLERCRIIHQRLKLINKGIVEERVKNVQKKVEGIMKKTNKVYKKWVVINTGNYLTKKKQEQRKRKKHIS